MNKPVENIQAKFNDLRATLLELYRSATADKASNKPIYITGYDISQQNEASKQIDALESHLKQNGIKAFTVNVFDIAVGIMEQRGTLEQAIKMEPTMQKNHFLSALQTEFDIQGLFLPKLNETIPEDADFVLITGLGEVYPFIRAHDVINAIDSQYSNKWIVFFYPGEYTGNSLNIFGIESDLSSNHYRAIKI